MIKTISAILLAVLISGLKNPTEPGNAITEKSQGIDVYIMSKPIKDYEVIEVITGVQFLSCKEAVNTPVNVARKKKADAVIIDWPNSNRYELIRYSN